MQNASAFCFNGKKINTKQTKVVKKEKKKERKNLCFDDQRTSY